MGLGQTNAPQPVSRAGLQLLSSSEAPASPPNLHPPHSSVPEVSVTDFSRGAFISKYQSRSTGPSV